MTPLSGYSSDEIRQIVDKVNRKLRTVVGPKSIKAVVAEVSLRVPSPEAVVGLRKIIEDERDKIKQALCDRLGKQLGYQPKPRDLVLALEADGRTCTRDFHDEVMKILREEYAQRSTLLSKTRKKLSLLEGELAMWNSLQRTYNMNSDAVASMLLRMFTVVTSTGRVSSLEVPYLTASLSDQDLAKYAKSLNFTVNKIRRQK